jgi:sialic acid synthase SpsE
MIDELHAIDTGKHDVIIKWQLFEQAGQNIPLDHEVFMWAYAYAKLHGYKTTASVFDKPSLDFLLCFDIPFVKIANRRALEWLIHEVPRKTSVYVSVGAGGYFRHFNTLFLHCISEYPAKLSKYEEVFGTRNSLFEAVSDHTADFKLWNKYHPCIYECHYKLPDSKGLDAGKFARTPKSLRAVL